MSGPPHAHPLNVNTDTQGVAHNETTIAVNPTNPQNLIGSANDYPSSAHDIVNDIGFLHAHVTFNGGKTWTEYPIPFNHDQYDKTDDPAVAFDADGTAYLAAQAGHTLPNGDLTNPDILVAHSVDGGRSWSLPARVAAGIGTTSSAGIFNDKDYIAAWGHGNAILTWTLFNLGPGGSYISSPIFASVTHDGGKTWTNPAQISGSFVIDQGSVPVVAADGSIYVAFDSEDQDVAPQYRGQFRVVKVDPITGQALGAPVEVALTYNGSNDYPFNVDGQVTYQDSQFRGWNVGNMTADPTDANHLAVIWSDMRNNPYPDAVLPSADPYQVRTNSDIIVSQSFDGGRSWSAPTAIKEPNDQFYPWGAYDAEGRLQIGYYDRSYDPANHKYGYTVASETDPGSLHFTFQQVATDLSDPTQGDAWFTTTANSNFPNATRFMGDYSNIAITPRGVAAYWTDMRLPAPAPGSGWGEDAFFALVHVPEEGSDGDAQFPLAGGASTTQPRPPHWNIGSASFLGTTVSWASLTSTLPILPPSLVATPAMTRSGIWSLDPGSVNRLLVASNQADQPLVPANAQVLTSTVPDGGSVDALGDNPLFVPLALDLTRD